jgi:acetoin utilization protein AcuB
MLHRLTKAIDEAGGNIVALSTFAGQSSEDREVTLKVNALDEPTLRQVLQPFVMEIKDLREINF